MKLCLVHATIELQTECILEVNWITYFIITKILSITINSIFLSKKKQIIHGRFQQLDVGRC